MGTVRRPLLLRQTGDERGAEALCSVDTACSREYADVRLGTNAARKPWCGRGVGGRRAGAEGKLGVAMGWVLKYHGAGRCNAPNGGCPSVGLGLRPAHGFTSLTTRSPCRPRHAFRGGCAAPRAVLRRISSQTGRGSPVFGQACPCSGKAVGARRTLTICRGAS